MRFLVDECTGPNAATWLHEQGYEVFSAYEQSRGAEDEVLLQKAFAENWILITNDKDFGEKVYREGRPHHGVVFLRLEDERAANKILVLKQLLAQYAEQLEDRFVVVNEKRVRFAGIVNLSQESDEDTDC
jgi:predicted nuclease of predicted toxin-antitoxin system